jgi:hypothetical protein
MRTVFVREITELSPLLIALSLVCGLVAVESVSPGADYDGMLAAVIVCGAAVGLVQGGLDRWRSGDLFFRHRPVGAIRFEATRTLAGFVVVLVPIAILLIVHQTATADAMRDGAKWLPWGAIRQLTAAEAWLLGAAFVCTWASVRYGISRPNVWIALVSCGALPVACWAMASRLETHVEGVRLALLASVVFLGLNLIDLAGDRR